MKKTKILFFLFLVTSIIACQKEEISEDQEIIDLNLNCNVKRISTGKPSTTGSMVFDDVWEFNEDHLISYHRDEYWETNYKYDKYLYCYFQNNGGEWYSSAGGSKSILYNSFGVVNYVPTLKEYDNAVSHNWEFVEDRNGIKVYSYKIQSLSNVWVTIEVSLNSNGYVHRTKEYNSRTKGGEAYTFGTTREYIYDYWE